MSNLLEFQFHLGISKKMFCISKCVFVEVTTPHIPDVSGPVSHECSAVFNSL